MTEGVTGTSLPAGQRSLLDEWIARSRLSWPRAIVAVAVVFAVLLAVCVYLDGVLADLFTTNLWRSALIGPVLTVYILVVYYVLNRFEDEAIEAFRELMLVDAATFDQLVVEATTLDRRREWLALLIGAGFGLLIFRPWDAETSFFWMKIYWTLAAISSFGLLVYVIYSSVAGGDLFGRLHEQPLAIDIFDPTPLEPIARYSLGLSLAFIGGITLSLVFVDNPRSLLNPVSFLLYGVLDLVAVVVFFLTMGRTHRVMSEVKDRELETVRHNLSAAYRELKTRAAEGRLEQMEALSDSITAWLAYEKRIEAAPDWPYTTETLRNLIASVLIPVATWLYQALQDVLFR